MKKKPRIAIIGLGYVGLPLAVEFGKKFNVLGYDINSKRVSDLNQGNDFTLEISPRVHSPAKSIDGIISNIPGIHNVQNVLATCAMSIEMGIDSKNIKMALEKFEGVNRRFSFLSDYKGIKLYDDYGHHPVEIRATLSAAREVARNKVIAIVQPHRYSRLKMLFADFTTAFNDADTVFITDIYSAGEDQIDDVKKETLISALTAGGHKDARDFESLEKLKDFVKNNLVEGDVIIFLGAGDITQYAKNFSSLLKESHASDV